MKRVLQFVAVAERWLLILSIFVSALGAMFFLVQVFVYRDAVFLLICALLAFHSWACLMFHGLSPIPKSHDHYTTNQSSEQR